MTVIKFDRVFLKVHLDRDEAIQHAQMIRCVVAQIVELRSVDGRRVGWAVVPDSHVCSFCDQKIPPTLRVVDTKG